MSYLDERLLNVLRAFEAKYPPKVAEQDECVNDEDALKASEQLIIKNKESYKLLAE